MNSMKLPLLPCVHVDTDSTAATASSLSTDVLAASVFAAVVYQFGTCRLKENRDSSKDLKCCQDAL